MMNMDKPSHVVAVSAFKTHPAARASRTKLGEARRTRFRDAFVTVDRYPRNGTLWIPQTWFRFVWVTTAFVGTIADAAAQFCQHLVAQSPNVSSIAGLFSERNCSPTIVLAST
jgi:hypothetical protein